MLPSEFENLTGIYPDLNLYRVIEHEYNEGDWADKAGFCHDYKFNVDGLATRLQDAANQRLIDMEEHKGALEQEIRLLRCRLEELEEHHECVTDEVIRKARMLDALRDMARDEFGRRDLGTALAAFDYLLRREGATE